MDTKKVVKELQKKYPGKTVIEGEGEIICEVNPSTENPEESVAIAVIDKIQPHYHSKSTEYYEVIKGKLTLFIDGKKHELHEADSYTIEPGQTHWAEGSETWIKCTSNPGWIPQDHLQE
ncbi:cupin domain-containing protein [Candidatus Woesebacteria bacterium]|nr:cupin domain-containing protein [Candidatus Woesebacteria bacterium]